MENTLTLGNGSTPIATIYEHQIVKNSINVEESVDLISDELPYDMFSVNVRFENDTGGEFLPMLEDRSGWYDALETADDFDFCDNSGTEGVDLREITYGTVMKHYVDGDLKHKVYIKEIERLNKYEYKISAFSAIGILSKQYHRGGVYRGTLFSDVMEDLIGSSIPYTYDDDVGNLPLYGYLPYATKRDNLHQIMFAENISIVRNENGDMHFTFLAPEESEIEEDCIFLGGKIKYPSKVTQINVTEHSFQFVDTIEPVTLVDNSDKSPATGQVFFFDNAPIYVDSLVASDGLTILDAGENWASLQGQGVLTGIPYYDKISTITRNMSSGGESYAVTVSDVTMITAINSENVADRLINYYTSSEQLSADLKVTDEKCGGIYSFVDRYGDEITAYLTKMTKRITSFIRATCEFVTGYVSGFFGNNYTEHMVAESRSSVNVPQGAKYLRIIIIGGGDGGSSGLHGTEPEDKREGGEGGEAGVEGLGGKIKEVILRNPPAGDYNCYIGVGGHGTEECYSTTDRLPGGTGTPTSVIAPNGTTYTSNDSGSYRSTNGIMDIFTGVVYAKRGRKGVRGGNGGYASTSGDGNDGEDIVFEGVLHKGGKGGLGLKFKFSHVNQTVNFGGAGGEGASAYSNGANGGNPVITAHDDLSEQMGYPWEEAVIQGGTPAHNVPTEPSKYIERGEGGAAGCGGAGRGGYGDGESYNNVSYDPNATPQRVHLYASPPITDTRPVVHSGIGTHGYPGGNGVVIFYCDKPMTLEEHPLVIPVISNATTSESDSVLIAFDNVGDEVTYTLERQDITGGDWEVVATAVSADPLVMEDTTAISGVSYQYRAKGSSSGEETNYSNIVIAGFGAEQLDPPVVTLSVTDNGIRATWLAVQNAERYILAFRSNNTADWVISDMGDLLTSLVIDRAGAEVEVKVMAVAEDYIASEWSEIETATEPSVVKAIAPVISSVAPYLETPAVGEYQWGFRVRFALTGYYFNNMATYVVERKASADTEWQNLLTIQAATLYSALVSDGYLDIYDQFEAVQGSTYQYRAKAVGLGEYVDSEYSTAASVVADFKLPTPIIDSVEETAQNGMPSIHITLSNIDYRAKSLTVIVTKDGTEIGRPTLDLPWRVPSSYGVTLGDSDIITGGDFELEVFLSTGVPNADTDLSNTGEISIDHAELLFYYGTDLSGRTGGFTNVGHAYDDVYSTPSPASVRDETDGSRTIQPNNGGAWYRTVNMIDITRYSSITMIGSLNKYGSIHGGWHGSVILGLWDSASPRNTYGFARKKVEVPITASTDSWNTVTNPTLSAFAGLTNCYLGIATVGSHDWNYANVIAIYAKLR